MPTTTRAICAAAFVTIAALAAAQTKEDDAQFVPT
jgi:hypothetical protein